MTHRLDCADELSDTGMGDDRMLMWLVCDGDEMWERRNDRSPAMALIDASGIPTEQKFCWSMTSSMK